MPYGLSNETVGGIRNVFARHPVVDAAVLFGSRAKGNFKPGSDIDLTLQGASLTSKELGAIADEVYDLLLPYEVDLSLFAQIENAELLEHIQRVGVVFYRRSGGGRPESREPEGAGKHRGAADVKRWYMSHTTHTTYEIP